MAQEEAQATLREALTDSVAQHSEPALEPAAPAEETVAAPEPAAEPQKPGRTAGRPRAPDGKLLPGKPSKDSAAQAQTPDAGATTVAAQPAPVAAEPAIPRPSAWKKEMWPVWDKLTTGQPLTAQEARQVAEYNVQREQQFAGGVSTYKQEAERAKPLLEAIAPFQQDLDKHGIQAPQMVHRLMSAHRALALGSPQEKVQQFTRLLQDYGIPLQALYDPAVQQQYIQSAPAQQAMPQQQQAPDINALVEKALSEREVKQTVASMERDTEKYPAFQYVRATMAQLLETNAATDLDDAYQQALQAPEHAFLTTALQQQQAQVAEAQRVAAAQKTAQVARANTVSPRSATPAAAAAPSGKSSVREALRESMNSVLGGARV